MDIEQLILKKIDQHGNVTSEEIQDAAGITRQSVHKYLKSLRQSGLIQKVGSTKGVKYIRADASTNLEHTIRRVYKNDKIQEDSVFKELSLELHLNKQLTSQAGDIAAYAFTELLNNAIEHSGSRKIQIHFQLKPYNLTFEIKDYGIGIFAHIRDNLQLDSERQALQDLLKGKTTTDEEHHSGEGIFFSSKMADIMHIRSHKIAIHFDNKENEVYTETIHHQEGTSIQFILSKYSKRNITDIFAQFSGEEFGYAFAKTQVTVSLFEDETQRFISRSEARRLLHRLDKFEKIVLDFAKVHTIGQGFAHQVFRVFQQHHPDIRIEPINTNDAVDAMIAHVKNS